jgi:RHS repeat-associated protein
VVSNANQTLHYDGSYAPFGESYNETGTTDRSFTGQNEDAVTDLYDFMYREYHPTQGRWVSPDPAGLGAVDPANPQSWNRYAYVLNNPLSFLDPAGTDCVYLNDSGDGVESIDRSGGATECWSDGGYWADGYVGDSSWVQTFSNSDLIGITSNLDGQVGFTLACSLNDGGTAYSQMFSLVDPLASLATAGLSPNTGLSSAGAHVLPQNPAPGQGYWAYATCFSARMAGHVVEEGDSVYGFGALSIIAGLKGAGWAGPGTDNFGNVSIVSKLAPKWGGRVALVGAIVMAADTIGAMDPASRSCSADAGYKPWILQ